MEFWKGYPTAIFDYPPTEDEIRQKVVWKNVTCELLDKMIDAGWPILRMPDILHRVCSTPTDDFSRPRILNVVSRLIFKYGVYPANKVCIDFKPLHGGDIPKGPVTTLDIIRSLDIRDLIQYAMNKVSTVGVGRVVVLRDILLVCRRKNIECVGHQIASFFGSRLYPQDGYVRIPRSRFTFTSYMCPRIDVIGVDKAYTRKHKRALVEPHFTPEVITKKTR